MNQKNTETALIVAFLKIGWVIIFLCFSMHYIVICKSQYGWSNVYNIHWNAFQIFTYFNNITPQFKMYSTFFLCMLRLNLQSYESHVVPWINIYFILDCNFHEFRVCGFLYVIPLTLCIYLTWNICGRWIRKLFLYWTVWDHG